MFERLGESLLTLVAGTVESERIIEDLVILSGTEPIAASRGSIVLGVGITSDCADTRELLEELGAVGAAALVLRGPIAPDPALHATALESRVPLLTLVEGAPWMYLADVIRPARGWREEDSVVTEASLSADLNLFKVANSLAEILDAPVTIEDLRSRVLAYSDDQERADDARKAAVLGQQVPPHLGAAMVRLGIFQRLYSADHPIRVDPLPGGVRGRMAIQIRAGDTLLGSIWAICDEDLSEAQTRAMILAANTAAAAILQGRIASDAVQRMRTTTVSALIGGGQSARAAAASVHRVRVRGGCVVAARLRTGDHTGPALGSVVSVGRLASSLVMFLRSECPAAVAAVLNDTVYAVLLNTADFQMDATSIRQLLQSFVARRAFDIDGLIMGVGQTVADPADLDRSRDDAELVLRVLEMPASGRALAGPQVATRDDVHGPSLVLRLSDIAAGDPVSVGGPLSRLETYDFEHQSNLVETLECWLEQFGDIARTAELLHVHKNTLRYRLGRIEEVSEVSLDDPEQRFELMLQFKVSRSLGAFENPVLRPRFGPTAGEWREGSITAEAS